MAACSDAKICVGIEKAEYPAACAAGLDKEFRRWMSFYGKCYRPYMVSCYSFFPTIGIVLVGRIVTAVFSHCKWFRSKKLNCVDLRQFYYK